MKQKFVIPGRLPGMNQYTKANRSVHYGRGGYHTDGSDMKRDAEETVGWAIKAARLKPMKAPVHIHFLWIEPNMRRDKDNIRTAAKFILDALKNAGIIGNDNWKWIDGLSDDYMVNPKNPRVIVTITERKEDATRKRQRGR